MRITRRALLLGFAALPAVFADSPPKFILEWGKRGKSEGEFDVPIGIAINPHDEIFVTEFRNNRVQMFDANGRLIQVLKLAEEQPCGIAIDRSGNIYIAHLMPAKITVYNAKGEHLRSWGKPGTADGEMQQPGGIAIAKNNSVYVADEVNHRIQQFSAEGVFIRKWGEYGNETGQFGGMDRPANRTGGPQFVTLDSHGNVFTTEAANGRIQKFSPEGRYLHSWGSNSTEEGGFGGRPKNLPGPIAIVFDKKGRAWVSSTNHRVQTFTAEGKYLFGMGGEGTEPGKFHTPHGLAFDSKGCLYVCDTQNCRIQKFST